MTDKHQFIQLPNFTPLNEDEILAHMGTLLINIQMFENLLSAALKQIFAEQKDLVPEKLFAKERRALGKLIEALVKQAQMDSSTQELLSELLNDRNYFIHHFCNEKHFELRTAKGRELAMEFLAPFTEKLLEGIRLFMALHVQHSEEIGFRSTLLNSIQNDPVFRVSRYRMRASKIRKRRA